MKGTGNKIVIRGGYGLTNFGDDALMQVIYDEFVEDKENLTFSSTYANYLEKLAPLASFIPLQSSYENYDILVYGGGTQFYSFQAEPNLLIKIKNNITRPKRLLIRVFKLLVKNNDNLKKNKIGALGVGVGPFLPKANPKKEIIARRIFKEMGFVTIRDLFSKDKCIEWGLDRFTHLTDICYAAKSDMIVENKSKKIQKVGVVIRDWIHTKEGNSYMKNLLKSVDKLRNDGYLITYIVFAEKSDFNWINIFKKTNEEYLVWDPNEDSIDNFIRELSIFDLFITARYHGAIYSSLLGKPFISIEVEQKLKLISEVFRNGSALWSYPFDSKKLLNSVNEINANYESYSKVIKGQTNIERGKSMKMKKMFNEFLKSS